MNRLASVSALLMLAFQAQTIAYTYDALGRVKSATYPSGEVETYTYDRAGNRTSQVVSTSGGGAAAAAFPDEEPSEPVASVSTVPSPIDDVPSSEPASGPDSSAASSSR